VQNIKVSLLTPVTEEALSLITDAARLCFVKDYEPTQKFQPKLLDKLKELNHLAPMEFLDFTFFLQGISRVAALQLVRHRTFSWMSSSFQYQSAKAFDYVIPDGLSDEALFAYQAQMESARNVFIELESEIGRDNARYVVPTSARTDMFMKGNFRNLIHLINTRICTRNSPEVVLIMKKICECLPYNLLSFVGPDCLVSHCTQGTMKCTQAYTCIEELLP
jgi:thymidylate synthase (FAD)